MTGWLILGIVLRVLGILLLAVLILAAALLWMPVGFDFDWRPGHFTLRADAGPLRLVLYPLSEMSIKPSFLRRRPKRPKKSRRKKQDASAPEPETTVSEAAPTAPASPAPAPPETPPAPATATPTSEASYTEHHAPSRVEPAPPPPAEESDTEVVEEMLGMAAGPMEQMLEGIARDPRSFLEQRLGPMLETGSWMLSRIRVRHLVICWSITGEDAADTALRYGREIGFWNTLLAIAQDKLDLRADRLRLEPDFTGKLAQNRRLACQITMRTYIIVAIGLRMARGKPIRPKTKPSE